MKRDATPLPRADEVDIPALKARYRQERDRRMRSEGQDQYRKPAEEVTETYDHDRHGPVVRVVVEREFYKNFRKESYWALAYLGEGARCLGHWAHHGVQEKVGYLDISLEPMKPK